MAVARLEPAVVAVAAQRVGAAAEGRESPGPDVAEPFVAHVALALVDVGRGAGHHLAGRGDDAGEAAGAADEGLVAVEAVVGAGAAPLVVHLDVEQRPQPAAELGGAAE